MSHMNHHDPSLTQSQSLRTPEASPRNTNSDGQSLHNIDSLNHERLSNSGISALIGQDSRGTVSPAPFSTRSQSITERPELSVQTSQSDSGLLKSTPPGGPFMAASWESPTNNMNDWPNRLFTTSPPTSGGIQYEYRQPLDQQNLASIQSPTQQLIQPQLPPVFQPPHGSLELFNLRVWEDCRGNNPNYWETVYNAVLDLQTRYGELVIQGTATAKEPRYKCGVCNHRSVRNPSRNKDTSQRRWDLSPHILTHARSPIKPWFSACGRSYGRSHDQRRHSENCPICKNDAVAHSAPQDPTVFSQPPVPAPRPFAASGEHPNALIHAPFPHPPHQHIQPPVANQTTAHISGHAGPSVGPNQHHPKGNMPSGSGRTFDGRHMTHEDHRERTMWAQTASHHRTPSIELPTPTNVGNAVMLQPRQAQSQMPFSPIEQPSGHCFTGYTYPDRQASWMPAQEKGAEVSKQGSMLSSCDDLSSMEKGSKKTRCNHESKITHRKDHTAVALGLIFAFMVFYFGLRWYLLG